MPLSERCISRKDFRELVVAQLVAAGTLAQDRVYVPRDIPSEGVLFPMLVVQTPIERKESLGRTTAPQFNTTIMTLVSARVQGTDAGTVEDDIDTLAGQVAEAVLCTDAIMRVLQHVSSVETEMVVTAEGEMHVGQASITLACETFQLYEPPPGEPLVEIGLIVDFNGDGVPDVLAAAMPDVAIDADPDGTPIQTDGGQEIPIAADNPPVPFNPLTGEPAGS